MIEVVAAPPYLTVQDLGRPGFRAQGVPASGAMDPWALSTANVLVGNAPGAAALEWCLAAGSIRWHHAGSCALAGAPVEATLDGAPMRLHRRYAVRDGSTLTVHRFISGRFAYLALDGGIDVPPVLGSRATYLPGRFGGVEGRLLRLGDQLPLGRSSGPLAALSFTVPPALEPQYTAADCRVVPGPHASLFGPSGWEQLVAAPFRIDAGSDRTGYRLSGRTILHSVDTALPSAPVCAGAVQVPAGGLPIVLMADAPTVGGYPVIAVVASVDLPLIAQRNPGQEIQLRPSTVPDLQRALRARAVAIHTLMHLVRG
jgi:antagonist of KipI